MIYFCADDYGLSDISDERIRNCIENGALNKVSVFPNFDMPDLERISTNKKVMFSLHLNLVEGKCMADKAGGSCLADADGNLRYTFGGLFLQNILHKKQFEEEVYEEVRAQVLFWKAHLPENMGFCIDSHQHTHMIPGVFKAMIRVLREESIKPEYIRIPAEPVRPYLKTPSLYFTFKPINLIKQWLLKALWTLDKKEIADFKIPVAYFFGVLFSGRMDEKRVKKVLPQYIKLAEKKERDIEVLFHPGFLRENEACSGSNISFYKFYFSENRKTEYDTVLKI